MRVLELSNSSYLSGLSRLEADVAAASEEAFDIVKFLAVLKEDLEALESLPSDEFPTLSARFPSLMHRCLLIWMHSKFYNVAPRLAVLLRQIGNALVERAREFVDNEAVFTLEPADALERLSTALEVCASFKASYFETRDVSLEQVPDNPWKFQNAVIFARLDQFIERCHDLHELMTTIVQFARLERIEIGGSKGRALSASIAQMHTDFVSAHERFTAVQYDVLDIAIKAFDEDFYVFRTEVKQVERRLASVLSSGFEDCPTVASAFKLIDGFEGLLERDSLQGDLHHKQAELIVAYAADLKDVQQLFHHQKDRSAEGFYLERDGPPLHHNMPPVAGGLFWVRGLIERIEAPMLKLRSGASRELKSEDSQGVLTAFDTLLGILLEFESAAYAAWCATVEETSQEKLQQPVLLRDESSQLIGVNFDPDLVRLLREVRYFEYLHTVERPLAIPSAAAQLHVQAETFRVLRGNLELIAGKYNQMLTTLLDVERPLLERELRSMDTLLEQGLKSLTWKSLTVQAFVKDALNQVSAAFTKLCLLKETFKTISDIISGWGKSPLMRRKPSATYVPKDFEEAHRPYLATRCAEIIDGGKEIHRTLLAANTDLKVSKGAPAWKAYVEFVNDAVVDGLATLVASSLRFLTEQIDADHVARMEMVPMLEIQIELAAPEVVFTPRLADDGKAVAADGGEVKPIGRFVASWIHDFFSVCKLVKRLDRATEGNFLSEVQEREEVRFRVHEVMRNLRESFAVTGRLLDPFLEHKHLWTANITAELQHFLQVEGAIDTAASQLNPETPGASPNVLSSAGAAAVMARHRSAAASAAHEVLTRVAAEPPLATFEAVINEKKQKADEVQAMPVTQIRGWLKLDCKPAKQALSTWVTKWMFAYTQHLQNNVESCIEVLTSFLASPSPSPLTLTLTLALAPHPSPLTPHPHPRPRPRPCPHPHPHPHPSPLTHHPSPFTLIRTLTSRPSALALNPSPLTLTPTPIPILTQVLTSLMADVHDGLDGADADLGDEELLKAMTHIHAVNEADEEVDALFEPMRGTVSLLRRYGIPLADSVAEALDSMPFEWEDTMKLAAAADERLVERKAAFAALLKDQAEAFTADVSTFRAQFREQAPFGYECGSEMAYTLLDEWQGRLVEIEQQADSLRDREHLFDVRVHPWKDLTICRNELQQLKLVWDHAVLIESIFSAWQATPWAQVNCDECYGTAKRLQSQFTALERRVRHASTWGVYKGTQSALGDMLVTLPLVQDLRDEAMRERHWKKLMRTCGRTFVLDAKFCLRDLFKLQLHKFADAVGEIVEQSRQEIKIDKHLSKIDNVWLVLALEYSMFKTTGVKVVVEASLGPVYEALDEHEAALQGMMGNRFVGFFENQVSSWKTKLGGVRATLDAWVEVQRQWCSLESIFLGSEDIREQLPDDAKRFDGIDASFKEQMADASQSLSPVDACLKEGRAEALGVCQTGLELCARSLSDYLETKRKKFPCAAGSLGPWPLAPGPWPLAPGPLGGCTVPAPPLPGTRSS